MTVNPGAVVELNAMRGWLVKRKSVQINPSTGLIRFVFVYTRDFIYIVNVCSRGALKDSVFI